MNAVSRYGNWGDLLPGQSGQVLAPGVHTLVYITGGRTLFGRWWEEWRCRGCRVRFFVKGKPVNEVAKLTDKLQREHSHYMSFKAVFNQITELKWMAKAKGIKFKADFTRSYYGPRTEAHGVAIQSDNIEAEEEDS